MIINGNFVDPMAVKLPRTRVYDGRMLGAFKRERDRIDQLMGEAPSAVAMSAERPASTSIPATAEPSTELQLQFRRWRPKRTPTRRRLLSAKPVARTSASDQD